MKVALKIFDTFLNFFWPAFFMLPRTASFAFLFFLKFFAFLWKSIGQIKFLKTEKEVADKFFVFLNGILAKNTVVDTVSRTAHIAKRRFDNSILAKRICFIPFAVFFLYSLIYYFQPLSFGYNIKYQTGTASWYGPGFYFRQTASMEYFLPEPTFTAAHKKLPLGIHVKVINNDNNRSVVVRINDRGPYVKGRIIDLSWFAAFKLGITRPGTANVTLYLKEKP